MRSTQSASITIILAVIALAMAVTGMVNDGTSSRPTQSAGKASTNSPLSDTAGFQSQSQSQSQSQAHSQSHHQYLVATRFIHSGDPISEDTVTLVQSDIDIAGAIPASQFQYGLPALRNVSAGSVLVSDHFNNASLVSPQLSAGYQAMAIPVNEVAGVGGLLRPGDTVNVIAAFKKIKNKLPSAIVLLKSITVLAVDGVLENSEQDEKKNAGKSRNYTAVLMVPDKDVARLLLASAEGELRLAITTATAAVANANTSTNTSTSTNTTAATNSNLTSNAETAALTAQTAGAQVNSTKDDYARLEDLFPAPPPNRHPRGYAGSKVQIYRGTEAGSVYVH